ncbi:MAG: hypothetical protein JOZ92_03275 [Candidatus Dormibacteraeota bacterium]|nr:hypothetical protein [Candidatus Dormibacteraeota bacterium]
MAQRCTATARPSPSRPGERRRLDCGSRQAHTAQRRCQHLYCRCGPG